MAPPREITWRGKEEKKGREIEREKEEGGERASEAANAVVG